MNTMSRTDWQAREAAANNAAARWAQVATQHEAASARAPWAKSVMVAMNARDNETRCRGAAAHARSMAFDVR